MERNITTVVFVFIVLFIIGMAYYYSHDLLLLFFGNDAGQMEQYEEFNTDY